MITMQVLIGNETIQEFGCHTQGCLASASSYQSRCQHGTLSGAVQTVINALGAHYNSQSIQECGLQALVSAFIRRTPIATSSPIQDESNVTLRALKNETFRSTVAE
jgi:hypothetical protein